MLLVLGWIILLALMYFASRAHVSLLSYLWGLVVMLACAYLILVTRFRMSKRPEPFRTYATSTIGALSAATAYTIWLFAYPRFLM